MLKILGCVILIMKIIETEASPSLITSVDNETLNCLEEEHIFCDDDIHRCLPIAKKCDAHQDCEDASDEQNCDFYRCESPLWFRCNNGKCISSFFKCDNTDDCGDNSDEQSCSIDGTTTSTTAINCSSTEWQCLDRLCIPIEWVCNGESECIDGSDETVGCKEEIYCDGFRCKNGQCIQSEWKCDSHKDCKDGSDEEDCESMIAPEKCTSENNLYLCEDNQTCLKISDFCEGIKHCPNHTETSGKCTKTCGPLNCSHGCIVFSSHIKCWCPDGYMLSDGHKCVDINECEIYGICDQKCYNTEGSYNCYCDQEYVLQEDNTTCKVHDGEGLLIFSSRTEIRGYYLNSQIYYPIAKELMQAIGVAYDGRYIYWTEIHVGHESIVRSTPDGTHRDVMISAGLGAPEDLSVDWITGNIYFTDNEMQHIGVCISSGLYCTILISHGIDKPRSIVLNPLDGEMYWTDWGKRPEIGRSKMDGTDDLTFISNNIHWPNGLALDRPNHRLYWTDAKLLTLESINLDGTDRRVVFEKIMKHPYGLAVFENRIYWSDWNTRSIESCDKFTGKNHHILIKKKRNVIYDIHVYHSALQASKSNPCKLSFCSDICLLSGHGHSCACPTDKVLGIDKHTCRSNSKNQTLLVGTHNKLFTIQFQLLGNNNITPLSVGAYNITAVAYSSLNHSVFISDVYSNSIVRIDLHSGTVSHLLNIPDSGHITAMTFDHLGNNLYWCDSGRAVIEVLSLNTLSTMTLLNDIHGEVPFSLILIPKEGYMYVAFQTKQHSAHIDRFRMDGTDRRHVHEHRLLGPLHMTYNSEMERIFWTDSGTGNIESTSEEGDDRHAIHSLQTAPVGIASLDKNIVWIDRKSPNIYWTNKLNGNENFIKNQTIAISDNGELMHLISLTSQENQYHPCQFNNGNCSHICLALHEVPTCMCPLGFKLRDDNRNCYKPDHCELNEFHCNKSNLCISPELRCNGHKDCIFGEDEEDCKVSNLCEPGYFQCRNKDCISANLTCDMHYDCIDKSDEENCDRMMIGCPASQFMCSSRHCIEAYLQCDGWPNCDDGSDEMNCGNTTCTTGQFRCVSGACIPKLWECDQELDCVDASDEHTNCEYASCKFPKFFCNNGLCIDGNLKCNGINDCGDHSDELSCPDVTDVVTECSHYEFHCYRNMSLCLPQEVRCNGTSECPQHEDEQGCTNCLIDEFECDNKKCIPTNWICDRTDDCGDGSDEKASFCQVEYDWTQRMQNRTCDQMFRCKNGQCIDMNLVCNDVTDCNDSSDEGGACATSCSMHNNPCSQICNKTPSGSQCSCGDGYKLRGDGRTCVDIEECALDPPVCSQICYEKQGSFVCDCYKGYNLRPDGVSCKSVNESMSLIFFASNKFYWLSQMNGTLTVLYSVKDLTVTGFDVSIEKGYLYFTSSEPNSIQRIDLRTRLRTYIDIRGRPALPSVDWISENVYYVANDDLTHNSFIQVCNFNKTNCATIIELDKYGDRATALTVDAVNKYLFYAMSDSKMLDSSSAKIYKSDLDGSNLQEIVSNNIHYVSALTYHPYRKLLYYANLRLAKVFKTNYDGINSVAIINNLKNVNSLTTFEDQLYFHSSNGYLTMCLLFGNYQNCKDVFVHKNFNDLFVIYQSSRQMPGFDACQMSNCTHLCVRTGNATQCLCDAKKINYKVEWCEKKESGYIVGLNPFQVHSTKNTEGVPWFIIIASISGIVIVVGVIYYFRMKSRSGRLNLNSVRFQNPIYGHVNDNDDSEVVIFEPGQHEYYNPIDAPSGTEKLLQMSPSQEKLVF